MLRGAGRHSEAITAAMTLGDRLVLLGTAVIPGVHESPTSTR
jgi:hypothetical protein